MKARRIGVHGSGSGPGEKTKRFQYVLADKISELFDRSYVGRAVL